MDPSARRADRGGHDVDEGGDVVAGHRLALRHGLDRERCALTAGRGVLRRDHAELGERFHREQFDLEPVREACLVRPHCLHLGEAVARDHSLRPSARSSLNFQSVAWIVLVAEADDLRREDRGVHGRVHPDGRDRDAGGHLGGDRERFVVLTRTTAQAPWLKVLSMVQPDGRIFCSTNLGAIGLDVSQNAHIVQALQTGEFVVSDYFVGTKIGPSLVTALPRRDPDGAIDAVFTALLDLTWFERVAGEVTGQPGSVALMMDGNGTLLARHRPRELDRTTVQGSSAGACPHWRAKKASIPASSLDGVRRIFGFVRIPGTSARFLIGLDESEILHRVNREMWLGVLALGVLTALLLTAIWFGCERLLVRPIRALTLTAQRFGRGEFGARASDGSWAVEFIPLATALDDMAKQLAAREQDLHDSNSQLEELARLDGLTGLIDVHTFNARLAEEWKASAQAQAAGGVDPARRRSFQAVQRSLRPLQGRYVPARDGGGLAGERPQRPGCYRRARRSHAAVVSHDGRPQRGRRGALRRRGVRAAAAGRHRGSGRQSGGAPQRRCSGCSVSSTTTPRLAASPSFWGRRRGAARQPKPAGADRHRDPPMPPSGAAATP